MLKHAGVSGLGLRSSPLLHPLWYCLKLANVVSQSADVVHVLKHAGVSGLGLRSCGWSPEENQLRPEPDGIK